MVKFSMTTTQFKKKQKPSAEESSRGTSPLCFNKKKNEEAKTED